MRPQILRRHEKVRWQFVLDGQAPDLRVQIAPALALQSAGLLLNSHWQSTQVRYRLLVRRHQGCAQPTRIEVDEGGIPVTFEARIEVIILGCAVIDTKARSKHCFSLKHARGPRQAYPRI